LNHPCAAQVGAGETAFDVAHGAASAGARAVTMSTRRGFVSVPASFGDAAPPLDCVIMNVGTHHWESAWGRRVGFHWWCTTKLTRLAMLVFGGSSWGWNQWVGRSVDMDWTDGRKHVVNKSTKCMPLLNRGANAKAGARGAPYRAWDAGRGAVKLLDKYEPVRFDRDAVVFRPTGGGAEARVAADVVVLATGYVADFDFLVDVGLPTEHFVVDPRRPDVAFVGYVRPNVGAIPPMAELQAMWWLAKHLARWPPAAAVTDGRYRLADRRLDYGVDYGYYMFALAREIGCAPNVARWLLERPAVALAALFGQAHAPIFRLDGPFASAAAADVCATELVAPLRQRGVLMNALFFANFLFFGAVNGVAALLEAAVALPRARTRTRKVAG
jgi:dimethylaniline monooxygenase (N-oxide forming)